MRKRKSSLYSYSLIIVFMICFIACVVGQVASGVMEYEGRLRHLAASIPDSLISGHFLQGAFAYWEIEFVLIVLSVLLNTFLRQRGSSESRRIDVPRAETPE